MSTLSIKPGMTTMEVAERIHFDMDGDWCASDSAEQLATDSAKGRPQIDQEDPERHCLDLGIGDGGDRTIEHSIANPGAFELKAVFNTICI